MADGSGLLIYGSIELMCRIRTIRVPVQFQVANVTDEAILGIRFLRDNKCILSVDKGLLSIGETTLTCTARVGSLLSNKVQVLHPTSIPPGNEVQILCRLTSPPAHPIGVIEDFGHQQEVCVAATLSKPSHLHRVLVRCINTGPASLNLRAGTTIGLYTPVEENHIYPGDSKTTPIAPPPPHANEPLPVPPHLEDLYSQAAQNCQTSLQRQQISQLLNRYSDVFSSCDTDVGLTNLVQHSIPTLPDTQPIRQPPRRLGFEKDQEVEKQVHDLVEKGMVTATDSAWSSPVVLVKKKDGSWRLCIDYRSLNAVTRRDAYPLPRIDDSLDALSGSTFFSTLDLLSGYWQVPLDKEAQEKSAFVTRGGLWKWRVLPFGLTSAPATFERLMERVLSGLQWKSLLLYLDDVIVFSASFDDHLTRLTTVLDRFRSANLKLKPTKCTLLQSEVKYLGHVVSSKGVRTDPEKVQAVQNWPTPRCQNEVRQFLGFVGYYRKFCPDYATIAKPLSRLTAKDHPFQWSEEEAAAFQQLRDLIIHAPILAYPQPTTQFILDTDASLDGAWAVLSQVQGNEERVIAYYSKTLSPAERNYCVTRRELLAVVMAVKHFRPYLYGQTFLLRTDHASLQWLYRRKEPSHQVARWLEMLSEYSFQLRHRSGIHHGNADGMSRICSTCKQCERITNRDGGPSWEDLTIQPITTISQGQLNDQPQGSDLERRTPNEADPILERRDPLTPYRTVRFCSSL